MTQAGNSCPNIGAFIGQAEHRGAATSRILRLHFTSNAFNYQVIGPTIVLHRLWHLVHSSAQASKVLQLKHLECVPQNVLDLAVISIWDSAQG